MVDRTTYTNNLPALWEDLENFNIDFVTELGESLAKMLKDDIKGQKFNHKALNRAYKEWKIKSGLDPRILIATGRMVNAITFRVEIAGEEVHIGIFGDKRNATLLRIHEFGTRTIPERSTLRALAAREHKTIFETYEERLVEVIKKHTI